MKLMNICLVFVVLFGVFEKSQGTNLICEFRFQPFDLGNYYSCFVTSLVNSINDVTTGFSGTHESNKYDTDVRGIYVREVRTIYIPSNLGLLFNITSLLMVRTQLVEIKSHDFNGMQDLKELHLQANNLTSIPIDAFSTLTKLMVIDLSHNQLEELPNGLFANNLQLKIFDSIQNKIKVIGSSLFDGLTKLDYVNLEFNTCIKKRYKGSTEIIELKNEIKMKCSNPKEVPINTTQTPTDASIITTQKPTDASIMTTQTPSDAPTGSKPNQTLFNIILITIVIVNIFNLNK